MSLVQHVADADVLGFCGSYGVNGFVHFAASAGTARMFVVVWRSHWSCRHTSWRSFVNVTSHSRMPAPMRAPARYASIVCSGNCSAAPRWPIEKSLVRGWYSVQL